MLKDMLLTKALMGSSGGGGGGDSILNIYATVNESTCTLELTAAELESAIESGAYVVAYVPNEDDGYNILRLSAWYPYTEEYGYGFKFYGSIGGGNSNHLFVAASGTDYPTTEIEI